MGASAAILAGASAVSQVGSAYSQSQAIEAQGEYQKTQFETNAKFADLSGKEALRIGDENANKVKADANRMVGKQRAVLAAQGIDVGTGSAVDIQEDTKQQGELAAMTIKNNAWREAWGYKIDAMNNRYSGSMAAMAATNSSRSTLLTGGINALSSVYSGVSSYSNRGLK